MLRLVGKEAEKEVDVCMLGLVAEKEAEKEVGVYMLGLMVVEKGVDVCMVRLASVVRLVVVVRGSVCCSLYFHNLLHRSEGFLCVNVLVHVLCLRGCSYLNTSVVQWGFCSDAISNCSDVNISSGQVVERKQACTVCKTVYTLGARVLT